MLAGARDVGDLVLTVVTLLMLAGARDAGDRDARVCDLWYSCWSLVVTADVLDALCLNVCCSVRCDCL